MPGVPLAIMFPERAFTLLDSNGKKTRFLTQVKLELKLANLEVHARVEQFQPSIAFDGITRAPSARWRTSPAGPAIWAMPKPAGWP